MPKKQKSGLYRSKVKIGSDSSGNSVYKWISGRTKAELERARKEVETYYVFGEDTFDSLFGAYAEKWYKVYKAPYVRASTRSNYQNALNKHILPKFGERQMRSIKPIEVQEYVNTLSKYSKSQAEKIIISLRQIFGRAFQDGVIQRDPAQYLSRPQLKEGTRRALTAEERERVLDVCNRHPEGLLFLLLYYTGMRRSEALGLCWKDVDLQNDVIHISRALTYTGRPIIDVPKTDGSIRAIPIPAQLQAVLKESQGIGDAPVVPAPNGKPLSESTLQRRVARLVAAVGIPDLTCYIFRHNYLTMLDEAGVSPSTAQIIAGHSDYNTTLKYYTHIGETQYKKAASEINGVFLKNSCKKVAQGEIIDMDKK